MFFLRLQSVFLSLVLYVILFLVLYNTSEEIFVFFFFLCFFPILRLFFYGTFIIIGSIYFLDICKVVKNTFVVSMIYSFIIIVIPSYLNFYLYHTPNITPLLIPMVLTLCLYIFLKKKTRKFWFLFITFFVLFLLLWLFFFLSWTDLILLYY